MSPSPRVLLLAHAPLASAWREVARHTYAECVGDIDALDIGPDDSLDDAQAKIKASLSQGGERPTLVLVDVPGATPANALRALLPGHPNVRGVCGLNVSMLWRTLCYRDATLDELAERAETGGLRGIMRL